MENEAQQNLESLKKFFQVSVAAFEFAESVQKSFGGSMGAKHDAMKELHVNALKFLETADLSTSENALKAHLTIDAMLNQMELLAGTPYPPFKKGGISGEK